jgi:hypothetical protein
MKKHYLHLAVYRCDKCEGPVVAASLAVRESVISRETEKQQLGSICISCGQRQNVGTESTFVRHFPPTDWPPAEPMMAGSVMTPILEKSTSA